MKTLQPKNCAGFEIMIKESFCLALLLAVCHSYPAKDQETEFYGGGVQDRAGQMRIARSPRDGGGGGGGGGVSGGGGGGGGGLVRIARSPLPGGGGTGPRDHCERGRESCGGCSGGCGGCGPGCGGRGNDGRRD